MEKREPVYLCPNCYTAGDAPGPCSSCGHQVVECRPGDADDPCRRPLEDGQGRIRTRAPRWWLEKTLPGLMEILGRSTK